MEETLRSNLIDLAAVFEQGAEVSRATIGKRALNDNTFYARIETGAGFNIKTFDRLIQWFSDNWPADVTWPAGIDRPAHTDATEAA
jgi:light-regulated signal transduction histidine kinase (bacteriophytochrome)